MLPHRIGLQMAPRWASRLRVPIRRLVPRSRFASSETTGEAPKQIRIEPWPENDFIRERRKIREHAGKTGGMTSRPNTRNIDYFLFALLIDAGLVCL
jgi:hypothetical protein